MANKAKPYLKNGDEIVFEVLDTKSNYINAAKALKSFKKKGVKSIVSFEGSTDMINLKDDLSTLDIPLIVTLATNNEITSLSNNISQVCISNDTQSLVAAHYIKDEKLIHNVGIIYDKSNKYSVELSSEFRRYYKKIGGIVRFYFDISKDKDLSKFKKLNKEEVEMIFDVSDALYTSKVLKLLKKENSDIELLSADGLLSNVLENYKDDVKLFNGIYVIEHYAYNTKMNKNRKKLEKSLKKYNLQESSYAFLAYDAYQLLYYALNNCVDYDFACINAVMQDSGIVKGISGNFSIIDAKAKREVYVDKIVDSKLIKEIVTY
jgi:ABC-type branched-subunit amino acid transport system substrate-binding protein